MAKARGKEACLVAWDYQMADMKFMSAIKDLVQSETSWVSRGSKILSKTPTAYTGWLNRRARHGIRDKTCTWIGSLSMSNDEVTAASESLQKKYPSALSDRMSEKYFQESSERWTAMLKEVNTEKAGAGTVQDNLEKYFLETLEGNAANFNPNPLEPMMMELPQETAAKSVMPKSMASSPTKTSESGMDPLTKVQIEEVARLVWDLKETETVTAEHLKKALDVKFKQQDGNWQVFVGTEYSAFVTSSENMWHQFTITKDDETMYFFVYKTRK